MSFNLTKLNCQFSKLLELNKQNDLFDLLHKIQEIKSTFQILETRIRNQRASYSKTPQSLLSIVFLFCGLSAHKNCVSVCRTWHWTFCKSPFHFYWSKKVSYFQNQWIPIKEGSFDLNCFYLNKQMIYLVNSNDESIHQIDLVTKKDIVWRDLPLAESLCVNSENKLMYILSDTSELYINDMQTNTYRGKKFESWDTRSVTMGPDDSILVLASKTIWICSSDLNFNKIIIDKQKNFLNQPQNLLYYQETREIFVLDENYIKVFDCSGNFLRAWIVCNEYDFGYDYDKFVIRKNILYIIVKKGELLLFNIQNGQGLDRFQIPSQFSMFTVFNDEIYLFREHEAWIFSLSLNKEKNFL